MEDDLLAMGWLILWEEADDAKEAEEPWKRVFGIVGIFGVLGFFYFRFTRIKPDTSTVLSFFSSLAS